jgi:uncharacterized protein YrzB (UPF0473 family)
MPDPKYVVSIYDHDGKEQVLQTVSTQVEAEDWVKKYKQFFHTVFWREIK